MNPFRRKRLSPELARAHEGFRGVLGDVERAIGILTQAAPTTRFDGRPLGEVLAGFESGLQIARDRMPDWRRREVQELEDAWVACGRGIDEASEIAERLRLQAPTIAGFEAIIGTIDALIAPLEVFEDAAERFSDLRR
ncbi:MAG: hypothetical protein WD206_03455 [Actinomycetota bacterium]